MATETVSTTIDPSRSTYISIFGKKGQGKSMLAQRLFETWPHDELVIDITGDVSPKLDKGRSYDKVGSPLPATWPVRHDGKPSRLVFKPDPGDPLYRDELDRAIGLAYFHRRTLLWIEEVGEVLPVNKTGPHGRRALHQGRHRDLSLITTGPRPMAIDPLVINQSDYVYVFRLPNPDDRRRVADNIGWDPKEFDVAVARLGSYEYLRYSSADEELVHFPPLPLAQRRVAE